MLAAGDVLLVAGKGHETGQIVGDRVLPFSDQEAVAAALAEMAGMADALWQLGRAGRGGRRHGRWRADGAVTGFSIDTRTLAPGDVFVALKDRARRARVRRQARSSAARRRRSCRQGYARTAPAMAR